jgi:hypothetical protein
MRNDSVFKNRGHELIFQQKHIKKKYMRICGHN